MPREHLRRLVLRVLAWRPSAAEGLSHVHLHGIPEEQASAFEELLDALESHGPVVSLDEAVRRWEAGDPAPAFTISFDDGYRSTATVAGEILARRGLPATLFIATGFVGLQGPELHRYMLEGLRWPHVSDPMSRADVRRWVDSGLDVGSHGVTHRSFADLDADEAREELVASKALLEEWTGRPIRYFAWPFGSQDHFPAAVVPIARAAGYERVFSSVARRRAGGLPEHVLPRRQLSLDWGLPINLYFALQG